MFFSSDGVLELESSLKKPIRDDNPFLPLICGGIEAVLRQGLKSKFYCGMFYVNYVIFFSLFAEKNPNKIANFFILNNGEFLRHSFPPSQANS